MRGLVAGGVKDRLALCEASAMQETPAGGKTGEKWEGLYCCPCGNLEKSPLLTNTCGLGILLAGGYKAKTEACHGDSVHRNSMCLSCGINSPKMIH